MKRLLRQRAAMRWLSVIVLVLASLAVFRPAVALAAPANDDFNSATVINSLPFPDTISVDSATAAPDDPTACSNNGSVWYAFTPAQNELIRANTFGSNYDTVLSAYTGTRGALSLVSCDDDFNGRVQSQITFSASAGTTYYFLVASCCGFGGSNPPGATLIFSVSVVPPPPNDNFSSATPVSALPFIDTVDTSGATLESGEPRPSCGSPTGSVWYAFTPATSGSVSAYTDNPSTVVAAYTGSSLTSLTEVGCRSYPYYLYNSVTIPVTPGRTYYFLVGAFGQGGSLTFNLVVTPPPTANYYFYPSDPSIFDTIQFYDQSSDPVGLGMQSWAWAFGDGTTATGCCPTHRYATDGAYTVQETVMTPDGRTATAKQTVTVHTDDVTISKFSVPNTARAGQTKTITVGVTSSRYPETVEVSLSKSVPGGFQQVGSLGPYLVPVLKSNGTVPFTFSYTFNSDDAVAGKVTFQATATIIGHRDALPADNIATSLPTIVTR